MYPILKEYLSRYADMYLTLNKFIFIIKIILFNIIEDSTITKYKII